MTLFGPDPRQFSGMLVSHIQWRYSIVLVAAFVLLLPMTRWFGRRLQGLVFLLSGDRDVVLYAYFFLLLPGTLVHELSHMIAAGILGVKVGALSLKPKVASQGVAQFGAVRLERTDFLRESVIGLAPLLVGTCLILLIARWRFQLDPKVAWRFEDPCSLLYQALRSEDAWIWIYLMAAIGNAMLPSSSDRRSWVPLAICLAVSMTALYALDAVAYIPQQVIDRVFAAASYLALAFVLTLLLDLVIGSLFGAAELLVGWLLGRRVRYDR